MENTKFNYSFEGMLLRAKVCVKNCTEDFNHLKVYKPSLTIEELGAFETEIDNALANLVGVDKLEKLRNATLEVNEMVKKGLTYLKMVKELIEINFEDEAPELLKHHGFATYYSDVSKEKQEPTISLLSIVARGADGLKKKFKAASLPVGYFDKIKTLAIKLPEAETTQEQQKSASKPLTEGQNKKLNSIYDRAMKLCKLGRFTFRNDETRQQRYVFKNLVSNKRSTRGKDNSENNG